MNEFLMEEEIIIQQENYIELSPIETFIPVAYFLLFICIAGLTYHVFPAKKEKSAVLPLGIIGGLTVFLFKIYIVSSIDGFDLILKKATIFPFNLLSIMGIYFGLTLGFIYSSKSRSWHFKSEEKPLFKARKIFFKLLLFCIIIFGLINFYQGFKMKYQYGNYPVKIEEAFIQIEENPVKIEESFIQIEESPVKIEETFIEIEEILPIKTEDTFTQKEKNPIKTEEKSVEIEKIINNKEESIEDEYEYIPRTIKDWDEKKRFKPEFEEINSKQINKRNNQEYEDYIPKSTQEYENYSPKTIEQKNNFIPETQKIKILYQE